MLFYINKTFQRKQIFNRPLEEDKEVRLQFLVFKTVCLENIAKSDMK